MPVLAMLELDGDTDRLLAACDELERLLGTPEGLMVRIVAPTEAGMPHWDSSRQVNDAYCASCVIGVDGPR